MSDSRDIQIQPTPAVGGPAPVQSVRHETPAVAQADQRPAPAQTTAAATTGGNLRAAYAQVEVNPDTHDLVIRILDATTDQVISETPSREVQAMTKYLSDYAQTLARHRAILQPSAGN